MKNQASSGLRYSRIAMLLHWLIAILVIVNWRLVEAAEHAPKAEHDALMGNHFAIGIIVLVLTVLRIIWRLLHKPPPLQSSLKSWEIALARVTHTLFYFLLIGLPMLGWLAMSSYGRGISIFGLLEWPALPLPKNPDTAGTLFDIHAALGTAIVILIGLHLLGVLKHLLIDRNGNIFRMLPFGTVRN